jgi:hypothetical protein
VRREIPAYGLILLVFVFLTTALILRKKPWCDEGWFFDPVYNLLVHGTTGTSILQADGTPFSGIEKRTYWQVPFYFVAEAGWMAVFGLSLFAMRALSEAAGVFFLLSWVYIVHKLGFSRRVVLLTAVFMATDYVTVSTAADGRMDMLSAALGAGALAAYLKFRERRLGLAVVLTNALLALSGLTHATGGVLYMVAAAGLASFFRDWKRFGVRHIVLAAGPYLIGAGCWGLYIAADPRSFVSQFAGNAGGHLRPTSLLSTVRDEIMLRYLAPFGLGSSRWIVKVKLLIPAVYWGACLLAIALPELRRRRGVQCILMLVAVMCGTLALVDHLRYGLYLVHVFPLFAACLAALADWGIGRGAFLRLAAVSAAVGFVAVQAGGSIYLARENAYAREYLPLVNFIRQIRRPGEMVIGGPELGFGLGFDSNLSDDVSLGYFRPSHPGVIVVDGRYESRFDSFRREQPRIYDFIERTLTSDFRCVYRVGGSTVYRRSR